MDRYVQFAAVAADEALADSGLDLDDEEAGLRTGVTMGSAVGGTTALEEGYVLASGGGAEWLVDPGRARPFLYDALVPSSLASEVAARSGAHGPVCCVSTGCTSGIDAIGHAAQLIQDGQADRVITGAADSPISPISVACFDTIKATTGRNDDPEHASRPFDRQRDGFVLAEGAAVLVVEELASAQARGAPVYCEILGYATRSNAYHMTGLRRDGVEMAEAISDCLSQAQMPGASIGYINAHGSGTQQNDRHETAAFKRSLGDHAYRVPISSIKSMVGHSLGAIGSIEVAATALAVRRHVVPPTANLEQPDPDCDLDYVPKEARPAKVDVALSVGSGFGGFQSAILLGKPDGGRA
jgi:minimal PKS ketosynthase (KS/KS alpha)